jgi:hypothetical protein
LLAALFPGKGKKGKRREGKRKEGKGNTVNSISHTERMSLISTW